MLIQILQIDEDLVKNSCWVKMFLIKIVSTETNKLYVNGINSVEHSLKLILLPLQKSFVVFNEVAITITRVKWAAVAAAVSRISLGK